MSSITEGQLTTLAFCWRLQRADGAGIGLTSCDADLLHDGIAYRAAPGITPGAISQSLGLEPNSGEVVGAITAEALSAGDLSLGRWSGAKLNLFAVDWSAPDQAAIPLSGGELGEVTAAGDSFSAEIRGAAARLTEPVCPSTSPECRAALGDKQCRVDLAGRTLRATVTAAAGNLLSLDQAVDDRFLFGRLRYLAGENCGAASVILAVNGNEIALRDRPRAAVEQGTVVQLREGCDKRFETCVSRFNNGVNFRGEPHLPGTDLLTRYPGA